MRGVALWACLAATAMRPAAAAPEVRAAVAASDRLFARWARADTPGCAAGVVRGGQTLLHKGWGQADLEHGVAIGAATVFDVAPLAEAVTARAVTLLVADHKLALDDSVRRWVPALPAWADRVTLRMLLAQRGGVRDYGTLLLLTGVRSGDAVSAADVLALLGVQRRTEFTPGARQACTRSGPFLLALVVERAAGRSLARFAAERIFAPLGAAHTRFVDDPASIVPGRAIGYAQAGGAWRSDVSRHQQVGDAGLFTTVEDVPRLTPLLAGGAVLQERGTPVVRSSGGRAGYRAAVTLYPALGASVAVLCNDDAAAAAALADQLAGIWLADALAPAAAAPPPKDDPPLWKFVGSYRIADSGEIIRFAVDDGTALALVAGGDHDKLTRVAADRFTLGNDEWRFEDNLAIETHAGRDTIYAAFKPIAAAVAPLAAYAGDYTSPELPGAVFHVAPEAGALRLSAKNLPPMRLSPTVADEFAADALPLVLRFARDRRGFWLTVGRPQPPLADLPFRRREAR